MKASTQLIRLVLLFCLAFHTTITVASSVELDISRADSGNYYVHVMLGDNTETDMLLDTGAGYVSLSKVTFDSLRAVQEPRFSRHIYGAMANGKVEKVSLFIIESLELSANCILRDIEVAVLPNANRDILGMNALLRMGSFTIEFSPARLTSSGCQA